MTTQAYFEEIQPQIAKELKASKQSIYVAVAWFTDSELYQILCEKARNGINVQILILNDEINAGQFGLDFNALRNLGAQVNLIGNRDEMMHNKFCVIDSSTVITGSYNWTRKAKVNDENITITKVSVELASDFIEEFNRLQKKYLGTFINQQTDLTTIIKRLEILKNCIAIQDSDDIIYQRNKLKRITSQVLNSEYQKNLEEILNFLDNNSYSDAMRRISDILDKYSTITVWTDPEVQGFKLEIRALSLQLSSLEDELADIEKSTHEFEVEHNRQLGELILRILFLKRFLAEKKAKKRPDDKAAQEQYEEAKKEEGEYKNIFEEIKKNPIQALSAEEELELKRKFRAITKLTHPDTVDEHFLNEATELFIKAKQAKDANDITTIIDILNYLERGKPFKLKHETITEKDILKNEAEKLRKVIKQKLQKIMDIKHSESYKTIIELIDWATYFEDIKQKFKIELEQLEKAAHE